MQKLSPLDGSRRPRPRARRGLALRLAACAFASGVLPCAAEVFESAGFDGPKATVRYALWGGANEVDITRRICREFVKRHPGVRVESAVYPWGQYWAKLQTQAASGLAPDVMSLYSGNMGVWIARGALLPLDRFVARSGLRLADYHRSAIENCTWDGSLYCMPVEIPVRTLVYSKDRLEEAGIPREQWPPADRPMTWEAFSALAARLTVRGPDGSFRQYGMAAGIGWTEQIARMRGGDFFDRPVNPARATAAGNSPLEGAITELFGAQYADRTTLGAVPLSAGAYTSRDTLLLSPAFAMSTTGPWALQALRDAGVRFGLAPMPRGTHPTQLIGVNAVGIFAHSRRADAAWDFVRFMASADVQPLFGRALKGVPSLIAARDSLVHNDLGIEGCGAFLADMPDSAPMLMAANSYVPGELQRWLAKTEQELDREYDRRLRALQRRDGRVAEADYAGFVAAMREAVRLSIRQGLPQLQAELDRAFARARPERTGPWVRSVLPAVCVAFLAALLAAYLRWTGRSQAPAAWRPRRAGRVGYAFVAPWLIGCACFVAGPILAACLLSFTEWNMISPPRWTGVQNYLSLAGDDHFLVGLKRTLGYAALVIPISLCGGLFTAGLLTCDVRGRDAFKAILYFPALFTGADVAVLWVNMFNKEYGVINRLLGAVGLAPVSWLDEAHAFTTVVLMNVFWIGGAMIIYYAGMKQIPRALYEAAEVDGAGPVRRFLHITIPMLSPVILFMVVMTTIGAFQVFTPALFFASSSATIGEPGDALRFYSVNIYDEAFNNLRMGRACCLSLILFLIIFGVTMLQMRLSRRFVHREV